MSDTSHEDDQRAFDRDVARAFGREGSEDAQLLDALCEVGMTRAGARGVASWCDDGMSVVEAASLLGEDQVVPGEVRFLVVERAAEVLRGRTATGGDGAAGGTSARSDDPRLTATREALIRARMGQWASTTREQAGTYADGAIEAVNERALREGWSFERVLARLDERVVEERSRPQHGAASRTTGTPIRHSGGGDR